MNKLVQYIKDSRVELKKVVWPTRQQTRNHTLLVIGVSLGVAIFLGAIDFILNQVLEIFVY
ncbi:MAG: Preprotein translocase, SecE subunit [Parcubacteria group bacterium GW2011_GWA2_43_17]|nr:MAG: Preprotein translocase, SecE subunit [Parcubacteria group bacterium GW2011_GWA2_43_17]KKT92478.1 MAG: Preprotein translocase, SecE subunit [Parcubacteria group bacterium GW2011_GWF2_45_11]KKT97239.1 MAG: Preprotein translocase, SecE subunit [Parcubacteria group bacterium GW2011_GWC2_45_15]OGY93889.1 MAG: preprotein translocase subunit SecE [Candidatus Komeilibacteria bacterium RIFOXYA2_FULL_45_9]OGY95629.1 MAG: preprotein translocase subunit SecE [Candidatus Komeilibacteria bacterium RI